MIQAGWHYRFIPSTSLLGKDSTETARQLENELKAANLSEQPIILVVDEINRLLENKNTTHHNDDFSASVLWMFLDKQKKNNNFFLIGTMNRIHTLPKSVKDRMFGNCILFPPLSDAGKKRELLYKKFTANSIYLEKEITDAFLDEELAKIGICSAGSINIIAQSICRMHKKDSQGKNIPLKKEYISRAINNYTNLKSLMKYEEKEETDQERKDRHHQTQMATQVGVSILNQAVSLLLKLIF
jgi:SpoVK/Ycf46/Vps4 family AAA+-type ATPase